jgi:hypothetical protein
LEEARFWRATRPPPPVLDTITIGWLKYLGATAAMALQTRSADPPGAKESVRVTGLEGYLSGSSAKRGETAIEVIRIKKFKILMSSFISYPPGS